MATLQPDFESDVIVQHVSDSGCGDQWAIFLGRDKRTQVNNSQAAMVFARLLADLQQRPIWIRHGADGELAPLDTRELKGCSCC